MSYTAGKEVSVTMEYNRQVPVGGAQGAEAAKARGVNADQRDMAFATVTLSEKGDSGQARNSNVGCLLKNTRCCYIMPALLLLRFKKSGMHVTTSCTPAWARCVQDI